MAESLWASFNKVDPWKEDEFAFCHHHNVSYNHRVNDEGGNALQQSVKALVACFETMHTSHAQFACMHTARFAFLRRLADSLRVQIISIGA